MTRIQVKAGRGFFGPKRVQNLSLFIKIKQKPKTERVPFPKCLDLIRDFYNIPITSVVFHGKYAEQVYGSGRTVSKNKYAIYSQRKSSVERHLRRTLGKMRTDRLFPFLLTVCPGL